MWNRKELKTSAKKSLKANYWRSVVAGVLSSLALGQAAAQGRSNAEEADIQGVINDAVGTYGFEFVFKVMLALLGAMLVTTILSALFKAFVWNPIKIGCSKFFVNSREEGGQSLKIISDPFRNGYAKAAITIFLRDLFIGLWSLLLIVPGIIKGYEYRMVIYIIADQPELSRKEVFALSKQMMNGNKWSAFVLDLSFIGWNVLNVITLGILGVFYVSPYIEHTNAALYLKLKSEQ